MNDVEAVKDKATIATIERLLTKHYGEVYADLWKVGLNMALRISDLLAVRYDLLDLQRAEYVCREGKTGKVRTIKLNRPALEVINRRRANYPADVFLFQVHSTRTKSMAPKAIDRTTVARAFKAVGEMNGVEVRLGTHSMRKTRGYMMWSDGVPLEVIAKVLNHSSPAVTMAYIGLTKKTVQDTYETYEL